MTHIHKALEEIVAGVASLSKRLRDIEVHPKLYLSDFTNYFSSSTIVGWTSFTESQIGYKKVNDMVYVSVCLNGTSDNAAVTFTLPYTSISDYRWAGPILAINGGAEINGAIYDLEASSATVACYTDLSAGGWSNSLQKAVFFQFCYEAV